MAKTTQRNIEAIYPLAPMQEGMLFHTLMAPRDGLYITELSCTLDGPFDSERLLAAFRHTLERHPALRTGFVWEKVEKPVQVVFREVDTVPFELVDVAHLDDDAQRHEIDQRIETSRQQGFDLKQAPLLRLMVFRVAAERHRLHWHLHHLVIDGWSLPIVLRDLFRSYLGAPAEPVPRPYRDYITWLKEQDEVAGERYWRELLAGFTAPTPLGVDRPVTAGGGRAEARARLTVEEMARVRAFAASRHITVNTVFQGAWAYLLSRLSGQSDVVFGTTVSGRPASLPGVESIVGLFLNTLPMRVEIDAATTVSDWLRELQSQQVGSRELEHVPLVSIQRSSEVPSGQTLFDSLLVFENTPIDQATDSLPSEISLHDLETGGHGNYPLMILGVPEGDSLLIRAKYDTARFDAISVEVLAEQLRAVMVALTTENELGDLALDATRPRHLELPRLDQPIQLEPQVPVAAQVRRFIEQTPDATAVAQGETSWSYRQ
ncbi:MAG: condensation domain-containing protein, partial [Acidobacteriota bacterium]